MRRKKKWLLEKLIILVISTNKHKLLLSLVQPKRQKRVKRKKMRLPKRLQLNKQSLKNL
jgi:hypothetical protein